ncbi:MAG TPA: tetratricopeptide repeat protein [Terracidiphilus sp.]
MQPGISSFKNLRFRVSLSLWRSVWFRYLALWFTTHPLRAMLLAVGLVAAGLLAVFFRRVVPAVWSFWHLRLLHPAWLLQLPVPSWGQLSKAAVVLFLAWLFAWAFRVRTRIFVASFDDYSGDPSLKEFVAGLPPFLLNELNRIRQIHEDSREAGAYSSGDNAVNPGTHPSGDKALNPSISVQSVGETLESAVTKDSKVELGVLSIPIGAMLGLFGRTVLQGPKLSGSVHKQGDVVTLIARMEGGGFANTDWRVDTRDLGPQNPAGANPVLSQLVEQLAYRVFTDLVPTGSRRWEAVHAFSQGLKHLRITTRTETDKFWNLRQAEASFIDAVARDNKFGTCYYNLGVVYERLNQPDSAKEAYLKAIQQEPGFAPSYYALAFNRMYAAQASDRDLFAECIRYCDQAIALNPELARAWDAKGMAYRKMKEAELGRGLKAGEEREVFRRSVQARSYAAAIAWRSFCHCVSERRGDKSEGARSIAVQCLRGQAISTAMLREPSAALFGQALYLNPADASLHFELGKTLIDNRRHKDAVRHFTSAIRIDSKPLYWAWLAKAQVEARVPFQDVKQSLRRALLDSWTDDKPDPEIRSTIAKLSAEPQAKENAADLFVNKIDAALQVAAELKLKDNPNEDAKQYLDRIERIATQSGPADWTFFSVVAILQARLPDFETRDLVKGAADVLLREKGLEGTFALGYLGRNEPAAALPRAERAVILNPLGAWQRSVLGQVYSALGDNERAEAEWKTCLDLAPTDPETLRSVAATYWNRGLYRLQPERRREMFERVIDNFKRVLNVSENMILSSKKDDLDAQISVRGEAHFWLGIFHQELLQYDDAVSELMKAKGLGYRPVESSLHLGDAYFEARAYDKAEEALREAVKTLNGLRQKARSEKKPFLPAGTAPGEVMPAYECLARCLLIRASVCVERGASLHRARRLGLLGNLFAGRAGDSSQKELKANYHLILGSIALKSGDVDLSIKELEQSVNLSFDKDSYLRLARAYLARAANDKAAWQSWIEKARDNWQTASTADVRGRCASELADIKARLDAAERENRVSEKEKASAAGSIMGQGREASAGQMQPDTSPSKSTSGKDIR